MSDVTSMIEKLKELHARHVSLDSNVVEGCEEAQEMPASAQSAQALLGGFVEKVEGIRKSVEDMATSLGVSIGPGSLAVPIPVELLKNIVERLLSLEDRSLPAVEVVWTDESTEQPIHRKH
jgi:L-cysteine desulfidase